MIISFAVIGATTIACSCLASSCWVARCRGIRPSAPARPVAAIVDGKVVAFFCAYIRSDTIDACCSIQASKLYKF